MEKELKQYLETKWSALSVLTKLSVSLKDARKYSCQAIACNLTPITYTEQEIIELEEGQPFCYLIRVDTSDTASYNYKEYIDEFKERTFISFSTITESNISHYKTKRPFILAYNMPADAIVHVFPFDSNTYTRVDKEDNISFFPSMWLELKSLNALTNIIGRYNQITCKTKIDGKVIKPAAVIVFNESNKEAEEVAKRFKLPIIITHPKKDAINFVGDACEDVSAITRLAYIFNAVFGKTIKTEYDKIAFDAFMEEIKLMALEYLN